MQTFLAQFHTFFKLAYFSDDDDDDDDDDNSSGGNTPSMTKSCKIFSKIIVTLLISDASVLGNVLLRSTIK